ncbi:hypothetical protein FB389_1464 [Rarobacter incanus]|uniref:Lipoprotein n=2 Tax=Rarobacter incanus TaxID=153494 RepID=A0A542SQA1_9MICO|nr:hypothetical protein FB389_1464 [Rarobacter incanus]
MRSGMMRSNRRAGLLGLLLALVVTLSSCAKHSPSTDLDEETGSVVAVRSDILDDDYAIHFPEAAATKTLNLVSDGRGCVYGVLDGHLHPLLLPSNGHNSSIGTFVKDKNGNRVAVPEATSGKPDSAPRIEAAVTQMGEAPLDQSSRLSQLVGFCPTGLPVLAVEDIAYNDSRDTITVDFPHRTLQKSDLLASEVSTYFSGVPRDFSLSLRVSPEGCLYGKSEGAEHPLILPGGSATTESDSGDLTITLPDGGQINAAFSEIFNNNSGPTVDALAVEMQSGKDLSIFSLLNRVAIDCSTGATPLLLDQVVALE